MTIPRWRRVLPPFAVTLFFALVVALFFGRALVQEGVYYYGSDFVHLNFPQNAFGASSLQRGVIPLWNPLAAAGKPFLADPNVGFLYPLNLLFVWLDFDYQAMVAIAVFHFFLNGIAVYALARDLGASRSGSMFAGIAFMFCGFLIGHGEHPNIIISTSWLPLVFLFFRRAILRRHARYALAAGGTLALSVLGHAQFSLMMIMWCGLWLIGHWVSKRSLGLGRDMALTLLMLATASAAAAVQILPAIELVANSERGQLGAAEAMAHGLHPLAWPLFLLPNYLGSNAMQAASFWPGQFVNLNELYGYVGVSTLFFAFLGAYLWRTYDKRFLLLILILGALLAVGALTPIYALLYDLLPFMRFVRVPSRFLYWIDLALVLLAAFGVDFIGATFNQARWRLWRDAVLLALFACAAAVALRFLYPLLTPLHVPGSHPEADLISAGRIQDMNRLILLLLGLLALLLFHRYLQRRRFLLAALVLALLLSDLFSAQFAYLFTTNDPLTGFRHPVVVELWEKKGVNYRLDTVTPSVTGWEPLIGLVHGLPMASALPWDPFDLTLFSEYRSAISRDSDFYDLLAVKLLVAGRAQTVEEKWVRQEVGSSAVDVYANRRSLPRAFMAYHALVEPDSDRALQLIYEEAFDPRQTVLLSSGEPFSGRAGEAAVEWLVADNNEIVLQVTTNEPGYLVISDTF